MELHFIQLPARGVHQQVAGALALVEPTDQLADDCPQYPLPQHALAKAVVEEACKPTVARTGQRGGLARYGADLVLVLVRVHALLDDYAAYDDEQRVDPCLLGFRQLNLKFVQKR